MPNRKTMVALVFALMCGGNTVYAQEAVPTHGDSRGDPSAKIEKRKEENVRKARNNKEREEKKKKKQEAEKFTRKNLLKALSPEAKAWYEDHWIELLITDEELRVLSEIKTAWDLTDFVNGFWERRADIHPDYAEMFLARVNEAKEDFETPQDPRAKAFVLIGAPGNVTLINGRPRWGLFPMSCNSMVPIEIWSYQGSYIEALHTREAVLIFYCRSGMCAKGLWQLWIPSPVEGADVFRNATEKGASIPGGEPLNLQSECPGIAFEFEQKLNQSRSTLGSMGERSGGIFDPPFVNTEGSGRVLNTRTDERTGAPKLAFARDPIIVGSPSNISVGKTSLDIYFAVSTEGLSLRTVGSDSSYNLSVVVRVFQKKDEGWVVYENPTTNKSGRLTPEFLFTQEEGDEGMLTVGIHEELNPGTYRFSVKIIDLNNPENPGEVIWQEGITIAPSETSPPSKNSFLDEHFFEMPTTAKPVARVASVALYAGMLAYDDVPAGDEEPEKATPVSYENPIELLPFRREPVVGNQRFRVRVSEAVRSVDYYLDGKGPITTTRHPFSLELSLSDVPRAHEVRVVAYADTARKVLLGEDLYTLNKPYRSFEMRITSPVTGAVTEGNVQVHVAVKYLEKSQKMSRVEFFVNDERVGQTTEMPYAYTVSVTGDVTVIRAVGTLEGGESAQAFVIVNTPAFSEEEKVNLVELYVTALDGKNGTQVQGLETASFQVFEDGVPQRIHTFSKEFPLSVGVAIDTSDSAKAILLKALQAARGFIEKTFRKDDAGFTMGVGEAPYFIAEPTRNKEALMSSLLRPRARGYSAIYDGLLSGIYYLEGFGENQVVEGGISRSVDGKRALVFLTGESLVGNQLSSAADNVSKTSFETLLRYAEESDVALYVIGIDVQLGQEVSAEFWKKIDRLTFATGGKTYYVPTIEDLSGVYEEISTELRSQYYVSYYSDPPPRGHEWKSIEVKVKDPRVKGLRHKRGYYP